MAKDISLKISGNVDGAEREIRKLQATGQQVASVLEQSFSQLGLQSSVAVEAQQAAYISAYERIRNSGTATWQEVQSAHAAMTAKVTELATRLDPVGTKLARIDQEIAAMMASGESVVDRLSVAFEQLGIRSTAAIEKERATAVAAYEQIRASGVATWQEIQTAHAAMTTKVQALDLESKFGPGSAGAKTFTQHIDDIGGAVDRLTPRFTGLVASLAIFYAGSKLWDGFKYGIQSVDDFQQAVTKSAAIIASLSQDKDIAGSYQRAKEYATGLNDVLMQVDSRTNLNLANLQAITEEMVKQGVVLDYTNAQQVEGFTRLANAVAVYSRNGADERQLRQEVSALLKGQVDQNSQLASMLQRTVDGPLKKQVEQWIASGTIVKELGERLSGFGPAADDLATSWSSVKSSLETSISLVMRAGFSDIVKDVAGWFGKINDYLKTHREEIGTKIKGAWEEAKSLMSDAATIARAIYNNFEPFTVLFVGGALLTGLAKAVGLFTTLRDLAVSTSAAMAGIGMVGAGAGAAGAAGTAAGAAGAGGLSGIFTGSAAAGTGILGSTISWGALGSAVLPAIPLGIGVGYAAQPAVRWADRALYNKFGISLTYEEMYRQQQQRSADADSRWTFFQSQNERSPQNRAVSAAVIPQLNLGPSQEQNKDRLELLNKQLADYKSAAVQQTVYAKGQSEIALENWKNQYAQGKISTADYYSYVEEMDRWAGQSRIDEAKWVVDAQSVIFEAAKSMFGSGSKEALDESRKLTDAQKELQSVTFAYDKSVIVNAEQKRVALKQEADGYSKLRSETLSAAGEYIAAEQEKQSLEEKSLEYQRMKLAAEGGEAYAVAALADTEKRRAVDNATAAAKEHEAARQYEADKARMQDEVEALNGVDREVIKTNAELRDGMNKEKDLRDKLSIAWAVGNAKAISGLNAEISLQEQLNLRLQREIELRNRRDELTGKIVGYSGNTPIYADSYQKQQAANGYVSNAQLLSNAGAEVGKNYWGESVDKNGNVINPYGMPSMTTWTPLAVGTNFIPYDNFPALLHKGEAVVPAKYNNGGQGVSFHGDINITVQGGETTSVMARDLARKILSEVNDLNRRRLG
ncbi:hypothetical protein KP001_16295 [Geomonas subterranea]|uniref:Uncharacterized protein n=1 Tax=Geomonas subterranea TaxID=2847989 RepID=A0ABX8LF44_9BACT|nr:hypothetical protein [Geomonas subterranea]QXE89966.1 hypothetical protein KP001_16295 [Geomonas subterranea]QXM07914.1 hypothetical protein KP002_12985 [Geomonas subterranea]